MMTTMPEDPIENKINEQAQQEYEVVAENRTMIEINDQVDSNEKTQTYRNTAPHWAAIGVIFMAVFLLIITYISLLRPDLISDPTLDTLAYVSQREVKLFEVTYNTLRSKPPDQGKGGESKSFQQLDLQIHRGVTNQIDSLDLRYELLEPLNLTSQDSFRIQLKTNQKNVLYLYLQNPAGEFQELHRQLNLQMQPANKKAFLPAKPNWFYIPGEAGEYQLYLLSTPAEMVELESLYEQCVNGFEPVGSEDNCSPFQSYLLDIENDAGDKTEVWKLAFQFDD